MNSPKPEESIEFIEVSSDSEGPQAQQAQTEMVFTSTVARLGLGYTKRLELPGIHVGWGTTRWMILRSQTGLEYEVKLESKPGIYVITGGWDLVVAVERLQDNQKVRIELHGDSLLLTNMSPTPTGSQPGFIHGVDVESENVFNFKEEDFMFGPHTEPDYPVMVAMHRIWEEAKCDSRMYVCTVMPSQHNKGAMFFSTEYSSLLPKEKHTVALRFLDSSVAIAGSINRDQGGVARISRGWDRFVEAHQINEGDVLVFRCYRGPSVWEVLVCRAQAA